MQICESVCSATAANATIWVLVNVTRYTRSNLFSFPFPSSLQNCCRWISGSSSGDVTWKPILHDNQVPGPRYQNGHSPVAFKILTKVIFGEEYSCRVRLYLRFWKYAKVWSRQRLTKFSKDSKSKHRMSVSKHISHVCSIALPELQNVCLLYFVPQFFLCFIQTKGGILKRRSWSRNVLRMWRMWVMSQSDPLTEDILPSPHVFTGPQQHLLSFRKKFPEHFYLFCSDFLHSHLMVLCH